MAPLLSSMDFHELAVKTGSIALQKFFLFFFPFCFFIAGKVCYLGSIFFLDLAQKTNAILFFNILAIFGVKNCCALFHEIE